MEPGFEFERQDGDNGVKWHADYSVTAAIGGLICGLRRVRRRLSHVGGMCLSDIGMLLRGCIRRSVAVVFGLVLRLAGPEQIFEKLKHVDFRTVRTRSPVSLRYGSRPTGCRIYAIGGVFFPDGEIPSLNEGWHIVLQACSFGASVLCPIRGLACPVAASFSVLRQYRKCSAKRGVCPGGNASQKKSRSCPKREYSLLYSPR